MRLEEIDEDLESVKAQLQIANLEFGECKAILDSNQGLKAYLDFKRDLFQTKLDSLGDSSESNGQAEIFSIPAAGGKET
jgi:hypothetical protein